MCVCVCVVCVVSMTPRLHEEDRRLQPSLSPSAFRQLLFNLTALRITNAGGPNCKYTEPVCACACVCMWSLSILILSPSQGALVYFLIRVPPPVAWLAYASLEQAKENRHGSCACPLKPSCHGLSITFSLFSSDSIMAWFIQTHTHTQTGGQACSLTGVVLCLCVESIFPSLLLSLTPSHMQTHTLFLFPLSSSMSF